MYRKDYLQRQFEEFGKVMALLMSLRKQKNHENFEKEYFLAFLKYTSLDPDHIVAMPMDRFISTCLQSDAISTTQVNQLADLLFEKLNFYLEQGLTVNTIDLIEKCWVLYSFLNENVTQNEFNLGNHYRLNALETLRKKS